MDMDTLTEVCDRMIKVSLFGLLVLMRFDLLFFIFDIKKKKSPKIIEWVILSEVIFSILLFVVSLNLYFSERLLVAIIPFYFSFFCLIMTLNLASGKKWARWFCLILSIIRIPTVIGMLFSMFAIYALFVPESSKAFFEEENDSEEELEGAAA